MMMMAFGPLFMLVLRRRHCAQFSNQFPMGAILGFSGFRAVMDIKIVLMLSSGFSKRSSANYYLRRLRYALPWSFAFRLGRDVTCVRR
jgi:hypothetical protein